MVDSGSHTTNALDSRSLQRDEASQSSNIDSKLSQVVTDLMNGLHPYQRTILGLLAIAYNKANHCPEFSVAGSMRNLAIEIPGKDAYRLIVVADAIDQGKDPLIELEQFPQLIPPQTLVILRMAESQGYLKNLYSQIITRRSDPGQPLEPPNTRTKFGAFAELWFISSLFSFFLVKIIPEFIKIFDEFGFELSAMNRFILLRIIDPASKLLSILVPVVVLLFSISFFAWLIRKGLLLMSGLGVVGWQHPRKVPSIERLNFLAMVADLKQPLANALMFFGASKAMTSFFPRSAKLKQQIVEGIEPWQALSAQRVITSTEATQISQASPDTQAWLLRRIASKRNRFRELRAVFWQRGGWFLFRCFLILITLSISMFLFKMLVDIINGLIQNEG